MCLGGGGGGGGGGLWVGACVHGALNYPVNCMYYHARSFLMDFLFSLFLPYFLFFLVAWYLCP